MRTLPLRLAVIDGESLPGYVNRYAQRFDLQPGDVVRALGLDAVRRYGVWLSGNQLARAAHATGLDHQTLEAMLLARFAGRAFTRPAAQGPVTLEREVAARELSVWTTRLCPHCLDEDGGWRVRWQLGWSVVCVRHRALLVRRCPRCGIAPRVRGRARWPRDRRGELADPACCAQRRDGRLCRASLTTSALRVSAEEALIVAQRRVDALLDGGPTSARLAGELLEAPVYLRDLRTLAILVHALAPARDDRMARAERACGGSQRTLDDPLSLAQVLPEALALADLPDPDGLVDAVRELADRRYRADRVTLWPLIRRAPMSPTLTGVLRRACSQAVYAIPSARMGFDPRLYRRPDDLDERLEARHVPQLFWAADYEQELAELFDFDDFSAWLGRRFCAIVLARMLAPLDWRGAVRYLDFPPRFLNCGYNTAFVKLRRADRFDELATRIKRLANQRAQRPLIDHKNRRAQLADWSGIDPHSWELLHHPPCHLIRRADSLRRAHASIWLWCQLTSGDERAAPIPLPGRGRLSDHTIFARRQIPALRERLELLAELLLTTPPDARSTIPNRLAAALHQHGLVAPSFPLSTIDPLIQDRVVAFTAAHTGIDIPTLTTPQHGSRAPAAVTHARLLTGALLRLTAHASWTAVASAIGGAPTRLATSDRAYHARLTQTPALATELEQLTRAVNNWQAPAPAAPARPHGQRMTDIAASIRTQATSLFADELHHLALHVSLHACRSHTDLTWPQLAVLHGLPAPYPALTNHTITRRRRDPAFAERYQELLAHAQRVRKAAGYTNAHLTRGLTTAHTPRPQENPMTTQLETSCQIRNFA